MVNSCFHNSQLTGNFTVGSDYVISGNLSPDLGFGIFGVRRMGSPAQMALYMSQFDPRNPNGSSKKKPSFPRPTPPSSPVLARACLRCAGAQMWCVDLA